MHHEIISRFSSDKYKRENLINDRIQNLDIEMGENFHKLFFVLSPDRNLSWGFL